MGYRRGTSALFILAALAAGTAARAETALSAIPNVGEHRTYTWTRSDRSVGVNVQSVGRARFDVAHETTEKVVVTDPQHAEHPVELTVTGGYLVGASANAGSSTITVRRYRMPQSEGPAARRQVTDIPVPPAEYRRVVTLVAAMRDAEPGVEHTVPGCGNEMWRATLSREADGAATLRANCRRSERVLPGGDNTTEVEQKLEFSLLVRFDREGQLREASGTDRAEMPYGKRILMTTANWTVAADKTT